VSVLGNVSLSLFLAMALMSLKLWELASLALPMIMRCPQTKPAMPGCQHRGIVVFTHHPIGDEHCIQRHTPTAIANMQAITDRFGPSHMAFLVVPMVGAFFIPAASTAAS
jgi:ESS family glutamate:Na+ symporter